MTFKEMSSNGYCEVCGAENVPVVAAASPLGPCSFSYCQRCYEQGLEPYDACVVAVGLAGNWPDDIGPGYQALVRRVLKFKGISEEQFQKDCAELDKEF